MKKALQHMSKILLFNLLIPIISSILLLPSLFFQFPIILTIALEALCMVLLYIINNKKMEKLIVYVNEIYVMILLSTFTIFMYFTHGNISGSLMTNMLFFLFPYFPSFLLSLADSFSLIYFNGMMMSGLGLLLSYTIERKLIKTKLHLGYIGIVIVLVIPNIYMYNHRLEKQFKGYNFRYMHGYSSTDFADYMVYSENSKLVTLDHPSPFIIEDEKDMPVMDGAEACYPVYAAIAKACYQNIDQIELESLKKPEKFLGNKVTFTNTIDGFYRLCDQEVDLFFGARPSQSQMEEAKQMGIELEITPIGKEAFVFFVDENNPIDSLTSDEIKQIYHGDLTNWKDLGGNDTKILAYQRPQNSGSQTMMEYFMKDTVLKAPETYEIVSSMGGVITQVAQYTSDQGAIGYTFRYFLEGLNQEEHVKMLAIDGISPSIENIKNGSYPLTTNLCLVTNKNTKNPNVQKMIDFILEEDGQYIIEKTGYCGLN